MNDLDALAEAAEVERYALPYPAPASYSPPQAYAGPQWPQPAACQYRPRKTRPAPAYTGIVVGACVLYVVGGLYALAGLFALAVAAENSSTSGPDEQVLWLARVAAGIAMIGGGALCGLMGTLAMAVRDIARNSFRW